MRSVKIGELRDHLSRYLAAARRGERVIVLDRNTPIARIVPVEPQVAGLRSRKPASKVSFWRIPRSPPYGGKIDIVDLVASDCIAGEALVAAIIPLLVTIG